MAEMGYVYPFPLPPVALSIACFSLRVGSRRLLSNHAQKLLVRGPRVDLGYAVYEGRGLSRGVNQFIGMRYAAPPLGDLRWRAPQDLPASNRLLQADQVGNQSLKSDPCLTPSLV